ncbi:hypothetical protein K7887_04490 [Sutcliffiella horikoshii]|uniref:hypothetical protein n=1 Tax=Sutcliffiella horikoshii TaxID=79883 RepID=UPI001CC031F6|nr:hypothetical protein [Sutcliffiella horikoshii]UAL48227.1 hypothetical protein K7887_04490 [Sutcliffiella horikoshii]
MKQRRILLLGLTLLIGIIVFQFIGNKDIPMITNSHTFGVFYVEEKDHHIEPGEYMEMWVIGYNGAEKEENKEYFKVYIKDANVYNLIEAEETYMFSFSSTGDDRYYLDQVFPENGTQLTGEGR